MFPKCIGLEVLYIPLTYFMFLIKFFSRFYHFIQNIAISLSAMGNQESEVYTFKMFVFERVQPAKPKKIPLPRSGHRIACDSRNLYSFGGYNPLTENEELGIEEEEFNTSSFPLFQELWRFNFASRSWSRYSGRKCLPQELASNAVIREGNCLMVYGGTGSPFGYRCSNQLYVCPLNEKTGRMLEIATTGNQPLPQYGQALVYHQNSIYTIGGTTGFSYTADIHRLNMYNKVWESVYICQGRSDYEPEGRYRHEVAYDGINIYVLGGGTSDDVYDFNEIPTFNLETKQWHKIKAKPDPKSVTAPDFYGFPLARRCHGAVQIHTDNDIHVFITGGYDGETIFDDLWRLQLSTMQWTFIENCILPKATYFHSAAVTPKGKMFIFGGIYAGEEVTRSNDIYATWLCIPKLSEMCWEALLHYTPQLVNCSRETLMRIGIPLQFVERLEELG